MRINRLTYEPSIRIGIVGAGCTGLTAAEELHDLGYKNITIIDAKNRVGHLMYNVEKYWIGFI
jgi:protoporphyrinogen oxidase